ncbi:MAG TPA: glucose 1-dehydrogenase [Acidimicrobiales bacterium]|nr:glucose 1-dehydrogenase [Acidimicrobiales bacterium]
MDPAELARRAADVENPRLAPDDILVTGRTAVVTGGGGGIGQGAALALARFGAKVAVLDVIPERCEATAAAITRSGGRALGLPTDVMDSAQLRGAVRRTHEAFGSVDILVNNAGGVRGGSFLTMPEASMRRHVEINLVSMLVATQEAANLMIAGGRGGAIVNVSSIEGFRAAPEYAVYAACKAGMVNFTQTMALELGAHGIRVNCIAPDQTITPGLRGNRAGPVDPATWPEESPEDVDRSARLIPVGRKGLVEECAAAVVWLCSQMSSYVTGETVSVDGGTRAGGGWSRRPGGGWTLIS